MGEDKDLSSGVGKTKPKSEIKTARVRPAGPRQA